MPSKSAKTPTKTTARKSGASTSNSAPKRTTVASLAQNLKSLETRMKGADTKNRNAIKALEAVVEDVKRVANRGTTTQKAALTRGLNALEAKMEAYLEHAAKETRASVRAEFANVTAAGADLATLEQAVQAAHERMDRLDVTKREALARLNRHIADLATSVDRRLNSETKARKADRAALESKIKAVDTRIEGIDTRIDKVEEATADALSAVGAKISEFASVVEDRAKTSDVDTAERLADLAQETQAEFNSIQADVTARLEALEIIASNWTPTEPQVPFMADPYSPANADDPRIEQMEEMIQSLQDELSRMHARIASTVNIEPFAPTFDAPSAHNIVPMPSNLGVPSPQSLEQNNPYADAIKALEMSSSDTPAMPAEIPSAPDMMTSPEATGSDLLPAAPYAPQPSKPAPPRESHVPQEFDPMAFTAPPTAMAPTLTPDPIQSTSQPPLSTPPLAAPPIAPPMGSSGAYTPNDAGMIGAETFEPAPLPVSTYDDPAYAEHDEMRAERIGGETAKRSLPKLPISGRNLRVGALAVGVGVVGLFAAKTLLGSSDQTTLQANNEIPNVASPQNPMGTNGSFQTAELDNNIDGFEGQPVVAIPPQGQYAETRTPVVSANGESALDAAVRAGNPIAQFQKGLVQLQAGQMEEGARLIRLAANRNQPAAQYRLAKLYESGTGVAKDPVTARELIERAARGGNRIAMHDLGNYYASGQGGLDPNISEALDWFEKAAERGVVDSQFNVAFLREGNQGVAADIETALFWYHVAARQGDQGAPDRIVILSEQVGASANAKIKARADRFNPKPVDEAANGFFRDLPWAKKAPQNQSVQSVEIVKIRDAQTMLGALGYEVGTPDGIAGSKTRKAIKSFESVNGMPETGQVTDELLQKLELAAGA